MEEKQIKVNLIFEGKIINLRVDDIEDIYGNHAKREVVEHSGGVGVLALDNENNFIFVKQYRYAISQILLEICAGKLEKGENPLECGKRELIEETGYSAKEFIDFDFMFPTAGYVSEKIYIYLARDLEFVGQNFDQGEYVEVVKIPVKKAYEMVLNNEIPDAKTQIAILKAYHYLNK